MGFPTPELIKASLWHYVQIYYLLHAIAFGVYFYVRYQMSVEENRSAEEEQWYGELTGGDMTGIPREMQIWGCLGLMTMMRLARMRNVHEVVSSAIGFSKVCICITLFIADWYLPAYFLATWIVLFFITSEPCFETPKRKLVKMDKKKLFDVVFTPQAPETEAAQTYWVINIWASWQKSGSSRKFNPVFAELSAKYSNDFLKFTKVDAGKIGGQPVIKKLGIDDSALSKHMPSVLIFKNGKEVKRLPENKKEVSHLHQYTQDQIERYFGFDAIFNETSKKTEKRRAQRRKEDAESKKDK